MTRLFRHLRSDEGFSVIEMLIVFTILAVAILPLAAVQFESRREVTEADRHSQAMQLAMERIERARMAGFGNVAVADTITEGPFVAVTTVTPDPVSPFLEEIQVQVSWSYSGTPRQLVLASKRADR